MVSWLIDKLLGSVANAGLPTSDGENRLGLPPRALASPMPQSRTTLCSHQPVGAILVSTSPQARRTVGAGQDAGSSRTLRERPEDSLQNLA